MLRSLYDYAVTHGLAAAPGFVPKTVKAYIDLSSKAKDYVDVFLGDEEPVACPDIGSLANGTDKSNVLVEKRSLVLPEEESAKSRFFRNALRSAAEAEPVLKLCVDALEREETCKRLQTLLTENRIKPSDRISFRVDGKRLVELPSVSAWWQDYRRQFRDQGEGGKSLCLITGRPTIPMSTTPSVTGLRSVGGHASGDALICFDKNAFCSYGLKQGANAPVSEEAYAGVKAALDELLRDAPVLAGMKFVHWYDGEVSQEEDPIWNCGDFGDFPLPGAEEEEEQDPDEREAAEQAARINADRLVNSPLTGERDVRLGDTVYHILLLSGVGGRVMIRRYEQGKYLELQKNLDKWNRDLALVGRDGNQLLPSCKLTARLLRLLKPLKTDSRPFERLSKELAGVTPAILQAILTGGPLPDSVAVRSLQSIRALMYTEEDGNRLFSEIGRCCQWLKVWLIRNQKKGDTIMSGYDPNIQSNAYHCGAILAIYERIQAAANPNVNVTVVQRYYGAAIQTPALVIGRLSSLSQHHLRDIERQGRGLRIYFADKLSGEYAAIDGKIPAVLSLSEQAEFALGYYQMTALLNQKKNNKED